MIDRKIIKLEETDKANYGALFRRLNPNREPENYKETLGYALFKDSLFFESFQNLLYHFLDTPEAHQTQVRYDKNRWSKDPVRTIDDQVLSLLVSYADKFGFIWLSFKPRDLDNLYHELSFEKRKDKSRGVVCAEVSIPGPERDFYSWGGSDKEYTRIRGIYVPQNLVGK